MIVLEDPGVAIAAVRGVSDRPAAPLVGHAPHAANVLNGIACDTEDGRVFATGKDRSWLFDIEATTAKCSIPERTVQISQITRRVAPESEWNGPCSA